MSAAAEQPTERTYSAHDLARLTGATYRQVDFWARNGLIDDTANGSGSRREFTADDVALVRLAVAILNHSGVDAAFDMARQALANDRYSVVVADVFELSVTVRHTLPNPTERTTP